MRAPKSFWLVLLSVVATVVILVPAMPVGPAAIDRLRPQAALAEDLLPDEDAAATGVEPTATLHTLSIPPAAFRPDKPGLSYENHHSYLSVGSGGGEFGAPVYLPQGARVVKLVVFCYDNSASYSVDVILARAGQASIVGQEMAGVTSSTSGDTQKLVDSGISIPDINNGAYSYFVFARFDGANLRLHTVKIVYEY
jgi:hypothetical protein